MTRRQPRADARVQQRLVKQLGDRRLSLAASLVGDNASKLAQGGPRMKTGRKTSAPLLTPYRRNQAAVGAKPAAATASIDFLIQAWASRSSRIAVVSYSSSITD